MTLDSSMLNSPSSIDFYGIGVPAIRSEYSSRTFTNSDPARGVRCVNTPDGLVAMASRRRHPLPRFLGATCAPAAMMACPFY
ncbi:hypothetical protein SAMN05216228_1012195 [Rhizobium tibeticum]|uniref:Uncharacterized protein n=1 Tax=Rhizobium tibeticum TaxID=501024 RepID=A0A1H8MI58_9HYPH|nr:hypothetical protein RTCCBAU85039_3050 [Rhizobium tibeticum]SEO17085.1 hypothetical protein SAMN05216228_1012195 [Rhizobium tibeticum]